MCSNIKQHMSSNAENRNYFCTNLIFGCWISWDSFISPIICLLLPTFGIFFFFLLWPNMWSILENIPCALEKKVYSAFGCNVLKISMRSISSNVSCKICVSLLIFCFDDLSIGMIGVLKSLTIVVLLSISPCMSVSVCLMYWGAPILVHTYLQLLCLPLGLIPWSLCSVLSYLL